jgi:methionyl-tRNA formyltransferase
MDLKAVISQPDRPKGRNLKVASCPVKVMAQDAGIPVLTPVNVNHADSVQSIRDLKPDVIAVIAYGQILKPSILDLPSNGCINVHASLLPKYRGAAPIQWAIANGEKKTGVTTMYMSEGMDDGDMILCAEIPITEQDTAGSLHDKLALKGAELLLKTLESVNDGTVQRISQNDAEATFAPKLTKNDGKIDWTREAVEICNKIRAFNPWPCCWCELTIEHRHKPEMHRMRILKAVVEDSCGNPGELIGISEKGPLIAAGQGSLRLLEVQPEGKRIMSGSAYLQGHKIDIGTILC